jgi:hypothetical protein
VTLKHILRSLTLAAGLAALFGCATPQPPAPPPPKGPAWVINVIRNSPGTRELTCVESSLATSFALVAFRDGHVDDDSVSRDLLHGVTAPTLLTARTEEGKLWQQTHDPAAVSAYHLRSCLRWEAIELTESATWQTCLRQTELPALLSLYRHTGRARPAAVAAATSQFANRSAPGAIGVMADRVYAAPAQADDLRIREQVLADCLADAPQ